jgi:plasmid maintenance system antidote protein VapI
MADSPHPLKVWIDARTTQASFARKAGCSEPQLSAILNGRKGVSLDMAARLSRATGGDVPLEAFVREVAAQ